MYALENPKIGQVAVSRLGHDKNRMYVIVAVLSDAFVLCADGKYRTCEMPKTKRFKHVKVVGESAEIARAIEKGACTDAALRRIIGEWAEKTAGGDAKK